MKWSGKIFYTVLGTFRVTNIPEKFKISQNMSQVKLKKEYTVIFYKNGNKLGQIRISILYYRIPQDSVQISEKKIWFKTYPER